MEPISHSHLVHMIKHALNRYGLSINQVCQRTDILESELLGVLASASYANAALVAKLGALFRLDWSRIWLRYASWRFSDEMSRLRIETHLPDDEAPQSTREVEISKIARQIILDYPETPAGTLAAELHQGLLSDATQTLQMIAHVRSQRTGDYV
jgi:hypothetical protein